MQTLLCTHPYLRYHSQQCPQHFTGSLMLPTLSRDDRRTERGDKLSHFAASGYWHWTVARISAARGGRPQAPEGGHASWADGSHAPLAREYASGESCHWEREDAGEWWQGLRWKSATTIQVRTVGSNSDYYDRVLKCLTLLINPCLIGVKSYAEKLS